MGVADFEEVNRVQYGIHDCCGVAFQRTAMGDAGLATPLTCLFKYVFERWIVDGYGGMSQSAR